MTVSQVSGLPNRFATSATINPRSSLDDVLALAAGSGFKSFEVMTDWASSAFEVHAGVESYASRLAHHDLSVTSFHLPRLRANDDSSNATAAAGLEMAAALGASVVILKADSIDTYQHQSGPVLDRAGALGLRAVVTNHNGSAITTVGNFNEVLDRVGDERLGCLLEIGHFAAVGEDWRAAAEALGSRIDLVHIKDMKAGRPVPYGTGEIDFEAVFGWLQATGYRGSVVVEIEGVTDEAAGDALRTAVRVVSDAAQAVGFQ